MPAVRQLARLFKALSEKNLEAASVVASEIADLEAKKGHPSAAQMLRGALHSNGMRKGRPAEPITGILTNGSFLESALSTASGDVRLKDAMLRPKARKTLETVITETKNGDYLSSLRIRRRYRV